MLERVTKDSSLHLKVISPSERIYLQVERELIIGVRWRMAMYEREKRICITKIIKSVLVLR